LLNETFASDCRKFSDIYISQGSVAMRLRCGGISNERFITSLLLSLTAKEFIFVKCCSVHLAVKISKS